MTLYFLICFDWLADHQRKLVGPCHTLINARQFDAVEEALPGEWS